MKNISNLFILPFLVGSLLILSGCNTDIPSEKNINTSVNDESSIDDEISTLEKNKKIEEKMSKTLAPESSQISAERIKQIIEKEREEIKKATLHMEMLKGEGGTLSVGIFLQNPYATPITSIQSWISFSKNNIEGSEIIFPEDSPFSLIAPGENTFDNQAGIAKIGISIPEGKTFTLNEGVLLATLVFKKKESGMTSFEFFNATDSGNTRVLAMTENGIRNVLNKENLEPIFLLEE